MEGLKKKKTPSMELLKEWVSSYKAFSIWHTE